MSTRGRSMRARTSPFRHRVHLSCLYAEPEISKYCSARQICRIYPYDASKNEASSRPNLREPSTRLVLVRIDGNKNITLCFRFEPGHDTRAPKRLALLSLDVSTVDADNNVVAVRRHRCLLECDAPIEGATVTIATHVVPSRKPWAVQFVPSAVDAKTSNACEFADRRHTRSCAAPRVATGAHSQRSATPLQHWKNSTLLTSAAHERGAITLQESDAEWRHCECALWCVSRFDMRSRKKTVTTLTPRARTLTAVAQRARFSKSDAQPER